MKEESAWSDLAIGDDTRRIIEEGIQQLRASLVADGFELRPKSYDATNQSLVVELEATKEACYDCLVPEPVMKTIIQNAVTSRSLDLNQVEIVRVGFDV